MPFGELSSNSYGTSSSTSTMSRRQSLSDQHQQHQQQQQQALRSRPNTRSSASSVHSGNSPSDLLFSHPQSSFDEFPYPPYSELPFTSLKRRKQAGNQFVKWAMRAVLASPVIVLVIWSIGAMIFSKNLSHRVHRNANHRSGNSNSNNNRNNMNARMMRRMTDPTGLPPAAMLPPHGEMVPVQHQPPQPMYGMAQTNGYLMPQQQHQQQQMQMQMMQQRQAQMQQPQAQMQQPQAQMQQPQAQMQQPQAQMQMMQPQAQMPPGYGMVPMQQQQQPAGAAPTAIVGPPGYAMSQTSFEMNPLMSSEEKNVRAATQSVMQPMGSAQGTNGLVVQPQALPQAQQQQSSQMNMDQPQQAQMLSPPAAGQAGPVTDQAMGASSTVSKEPPLGQSQPSSNDIMSGRTTVFYYDPKQTVTGSNGEVRLPALVYDAQGNPIDLASFAAQDHAQILLEAPMGQAAPARGLVQQDQDQQSMGQTETARNLVQQPKEQLAVSDIQKWGQSTAQDQNIIVATVAVMALLVGALSARRLRSRNVLSACIENESLEDDIAYDAAYSTTLHDGSSSYNTFGGGWKGDLEKFDV